MTSDDMPEEIYVRPVSKKTLSAVRPESPLINTSVERKHTKYTRADIVSKYDLTKCSKCRGLEKLKRPEIIAENGWYSEYNAGWNECLAYIAQKIKDDQ